MLRYLFGVLALIFPLSAYSQQAIGPVISVRPSDPDWKSVVVDSLDGQLIGIKKFNESYYFTPTPVVDWAGFVASVSKECADGNDEEDRSAEINLLYYHPLILAEIAQKAGIELTSLSVVPHFGHSVFLRDVNLNSHLIATDVDASTLLQGEAMNVSKPLSATERIIVHQPCILLKNFAANQSLVVSYHAKGQKFETASINAEVLMSQAMDSFFDTEDAQVQVDETSVKVTSGGRGLAIDIGPLSLNQTNAENQVETSREKYRAINRNWLSERAENTLQSIKIEEICGPQQGCLEDDLRRMIVEFSLQEAIESRINFKARADGLYDILIGQTNVGKATFNVDDSVKATLNTIFDNAVDGEFSYAGITAKKKDENSLTINGGSEFTKKGEEWIPTSLTLELVDTTKLQARIGAGYARTMLQDKAFVSYRSQSVLMAKIPEGFIQGGFFDTHQGVVSDLASAHAHIAGEPQRRAGIGSVEFAIVQGEGENGEFLGTNGHISKFNGERYKLEKCPRQGGPVINSAYFQSLCGGARTPYATLMISHGGRYCGYNLWALACVANR